MASRFKFSLRQSEDFKRISATDPELLAGIAKELKQLTDPLIRPNDLKKIFRAKMPLEIADITFKHVLAFSSFRRDKNIPTDELITSITTVLQEDKKWSIDEQENWKKVSPLFAELISSGPICAATKILDLAFDYANTLSKARILTDIRPVFDDTRAKIIGSIISQSLHLYYSSKDAEHSICINLDESDIKFLKEACDTALRKAAEAKRVMTEQCKLTTYISGEELYGD